jgi:hypothetical protein
MIDGRQNTSTSVKKKKSPARAEWRRSASGPRPPAVMSRRTSQRIRDFAGRTID